MRTFTPKPSDVDRTWYVVDATDVVLGRLASHVADLLRGKHKAQPFRYPVRRVSVNGGKADDKLISAVAGDPAVLASDVRSQQFGDGVQHLIARRMAVQVIDFFKAVKIQKD